MLGLGSNENHSCFLRGKKRAGLRGRTVPASRDTFTHAEGKMVAPPPLLPLLLLLSVGALLPSSGAPNNAYSELSQSLKRGVDLALEKLHSHAAVQQHFVFLRSLSTSDIQVMSTSSIFLCKNPPCSPAVVFLAGRVRRDVHVPPLLPQSHHLSQRDGGRVGVPPQKRQGENVVFCRHVWTEFLLELVLFCLCAFMQPLIDCAVCYKTLSEEIEPQPKPYVHCIHKTALTQVRPLPDRVANFSTCSAFSKHQCGAFILKSTHVHWAQKPPVWFDLCSCVLGGADCWPSGSKSLNQIFIWELAQVAEHNRSLASFGAIRRTFCFEKNGPQLQTLASWDHERPFVLLWLAGNEGCQNGTLQPAELQQRKSNSAGINRKWGNTRLTFGGTFHSFSTFLLSFWLKADYCHSFVTLLLMFNVSVDVDFHINK